MKRIIASAAVVVAAIAGFTSPASAHHPVVVSSDVACQVDGTWLVTWTAAPDAVRGFTWNLTAPVTTAPVPDSQSISFTTTAPGTAASTTVTVSAVWSNGATGTRNGAAQFGDSTCTPTTTTSTSTTTTTTTTAPESTSSTTSPEPCAPGFYFVLDSCIPIPTTTATAATTPLLPATTPTTIPDECWVNDDPSTPLDGPFVFYDFTTDPGAVGTHSRSAQPCGPVTTCFEVGLIPQSYGAGAPCGPTDPCLADSGTTLWYVGPCATPPPVTTVPPTLPSTGSENWTMAAVAALLLALGTALTAASRRNQPMVGQ